MDIDYHWRGQLSNSSEKIIIKWVLFNQNQIFMDMENYFISPIALVALVPIITEFLKVNLNLKEQVLFKVFKRSIYFGQLISVVVSVILVFIGGWLNLGFLENMNILFTMLWGLFIGFASTGLFDAGYLELLYQLLNQVKSKQKEK